MPRFIGTRAPSFVTMTTNNARRIPGMVRITRSQMDLLAAFLTGQIAARAGPRPSAGTAGSALLKRGTELHKQIEEALTSPTRNLVAAALRDAGFSVNVDGLDCTLGGYTVAARTEKNLGHTRTPVEIITTRSAEMISDARQLMIDDYRQTLREIQKKIERDNRRNDRKLPPTQQRSKKGKK